VLPGATSSACRPTSATSTPCSSRTRYPAPHGVRQRRVGLRREEGGKHDARDRGAALSALVQLEATTTGGRNNFGRPQQRVALARALCERARCSCSRAPRGARLKLRKQMQLELMRIQREVGVTFIYVTHGPGGGARHERPPGVMSYGHVEQIGDPKTSTNARKTVSSPASSARRTSSRAKSVGAPATGSGSRAPTAIASSSARRRASGACRRPTGVHVRPEKLRVTPLDEPVAADLCTAAAPSSTSLPGVSTQLVVRRSGRHARASAEQRTREDAGTRAAAPGWYGIPIQCRPHRRASLDADRWRRPQEPVERS